MPMTGTPNTRDVCSALTGRNSPDHRPLGVAEVWPPSGNLRPLRAPGGGEELPLLELDGLRTRPALDDAGQVGGVGAGGALPRATVPGGRPVRAGHDVRAGLEGPVTEAGGGRTRLVRAEVVECRGDDG